MLNLQTTARRLRYAIDLNTNCACANLSAEYLYRLKVNHRRLRPVNNQLSTWACILVIGISKLLKRHYKSQAQGPSLFSNAASIDLWNELDDSTVSVDNVAAFKRKL